MDAALRQLAEPMTADWVTAEQAAELMRRKVRAMQLWAQRLCEAATREGRRPKARKETPADGGRPIWRLSRNLHPRLRKHQYASADERANAAQPSLLMKHPEHKVQGMRSKWYYYQEWRRRCHTCPERHVTDAELAQQVVDETHRLEGPDFPISVRTLYDWHKRVTVPGADGHVLGIEALLDTRGRKDSGSGRSPEAVAYFDALYKTQGEHSVKTCHRATVAEARREGWSWPPGYSSTTRWLRATENLADSCLHRRGHEEYSHRFMQHLEIDYATLAVGERFVTDSTQVDFWVTYKSRVIRPALTVVLDWRSRCLTGWHLGPTSNQDSIAAAFRAAFRDFSVPARVYMDRGADFTSKLLRGSTKDERREFRREHGANWEEVLASKFDQFWGGIFGELGIGVSEATVKHPWAKGQVERWFRTFEDQCGKTFVTYCGNNPLNRPECLEKLKAGPGMPTLDGARERIGNWIELYNHTPHRGQAMEGQQPVAVWATATSLRKAVDTELLAVMHSRGVYRVGLNGVSFRIGGTGMTYGATSLTLRRYAGRDVLITLDPEHCECCYAYTPERENRRFIARLEANQRIPVNTDVDSLREAIRALRSRNKDYAQAAAQAPKRIRTAGQEIAAQQREQLSELRKTGTYDVPARPAIQCVRTGFAGTVKASQTTTKRRVKAIELRDADDILSTPAQEKAREEQKRLARCCDPNDLAECVSEETDGYGCLADFVNKPEPVVVSDSPWDRLAAFNKREAP